MNQLANWINKFEDDSYRFSSFLKSQILILKSNIGKISEHNLKEQIVALLFDYTNENYALIRRHYILLRLLSDLVFEFSSENYSSINNILNAFKKEKIKIIIRSINTSYNELIADFSDSDIGKISQTDATKLETLTKHFLLNYPLKN